MGSGSFSNWIGDADLTPTVTRNVEVAGDARVVFQFRYLNDVTYTENIGPGDDAEATFDPPPAAPTGLSATAGNREIRLVWDDPGDPGIVLWQVRWKRSDAAGFGAWRDVPGSGAGTVEHTVGGLVNGVGYDLQLRAVNANAAFFEGLESGTVSATPLAVPETPVGFAATAGDGTVALRWSSAGDASITGWQTRVRIGNGVFGSWVDVVGSTAGTTQWRMTGLANGTAYGFQLRAVNAVGDGLASATVTATPRALLVAPAGLRATLANGEVTLDWNAYGNRSVIRFETRWRSSGNWSRWIPVPRSGWQTTSHTVTGLDNGVAYRLELRAVNRNGPGPSAGVGATPIANVPAKPAGLVAQPGAFEVILSWRNPRDRAITGWELRIEKAVYDVVIDNYRFSSWGPWVAMRGASAGTASWRVPGLTNGVPYRFQVRAIGPGGAGLAAGAVFTTPNPLPVAPNVKFSNRDIGVGAVALAIDEDPFSNLILYWQIRLKRADAARFGPWLRVPRQKGGVEVTHHVLAGLPSGVEHVVEARGVNSIGPGPVKEVRVTALHPLDPPGNPAARADGDAVVLSWDAPTDDLGGALNWGARWKDGEGAWGAWSKIDGSTDVVRESGRLTWRIEGLALNRTWTFELRADRSVAKVHPDDFAVSTEQVSVATRSGPVSLLAVAEGAEVALTWPDPGDAGFRWELRSRVAGSSKVAGSWGAWRSGGVSSGTDGAGAAVLTNRVHGLSSWEAHEFQVRSVSGRSASAPSPTATAVPVAVPAAPTELSATVADADVVLSWEDPGDDSIRAWQVRRRTAAATWPGWTNAATTATPATPDAPATLAHTVSGLESGRFWYFQVRAVSDSTGAVSEVVSAYLPTLPQRGDVLPAAPTGLVGVLTAGGAQGAGELTLFWDPLTDPTIKSWEYKAADAVAATTRVANEQFATGSYTTSGAIAWSFSGAVEQVNIRAVNNAGEGPWSQGVLVVALPPPSLSAVRAGQRGLPLLALSAPRRRRVLRRRRGGRSGSQPPPMPSPGADSQAARASGRTGSPVSRTARPTRSSFGALKGGGAGVAAAPVTVTPTGVRPAAPAGVTATGKNRAVALAWSDPGDDSITAWQFRQQRVGRSWGVWRTIAGSDASTTRHEVDGLANGVEYGFRVRALNAFGNGAESVVATATPAEAAGRPPSGSLRAPATSR